MRAKKSLGQNFLANKSKLRKIAAVLDLNPGEIVIEIGPGHGELTGEIIRELDNLRIRKYKLILVEKDERLTEDLKNKFKENKNIEIIEGDALSVLRKLINQLSNHPITKYKIVGNIPYYITGYLLRIIGELEKKPEVVVLLIQKEVAQRIALRQAQGKHIMNLLAASVQFWAEPKMIGYVSKKDFKPAPKVDSAIIMLRIKNYDLRIMNKYYKFIKILFKQPRKTIANNLSVCGKKDEILEVLKKAGIKPDDRPQNLEIEQIKVLSAKLIR